MRRDQLELAVSGVEWVDEDGKPERPSVSITASGEAAALLRERLTDEDGKALQGAETDVAFRLLDDPEAEDASGVVAVTDRVTGEFVLELNEEADAVLQFITAARHYGEHADSDGEYLVTVEADGETVAEFEKSTFLVYTEDGELLRSHSLIPSGVEL